MTKVDDNVSRYRHLDLDSTLMGGTHTFKYDKIFLQIYDESEIKNKLKNEIKALY